MTDNWDPSIPEHEVLGHQIEQGNGFPEMQPLGQTWEALKKVGFQIEFEEDLPDRPDPMVLPARGRYLQGPDILGLLDRVADELERAAC